MHTPTITNPMNSTPPSTASTINSTLVEEEVVYQTLIIVGLVFRLRKETDMSLLPEFILIEYWVFVWVRELRPPEVA
jgi:hypothetical protein